MQTRAKRTRGVSMQTAAPDATDEMPTATAAASLAGIKDPNHFRTADVYPSLVVDSNESTPPPRCDDEEHVVNPIVSRFI